MLSILFNAVSGGLWACGGRFERARCAARPGFASDTRKSIHGGSRADGIGVFEGSVSSAMLRPLPYFLPPPPGPALPLSEHAHARTGAGWNHPLLNEFAIARGQGRDGVDRSGAAGCDVVGRCCRGGGRRGDGGSCLTVLLDVCRLTTTPTTFRSASSSTCTLPRRGAPPL
jgi:hypothetical protein